MSTTESRWNERFSWYPEPEAEALVQGWINGFLEVLPEARYLAGRLADGTGSRLVDWLDTIVLSEPGDAAALARAGFVEQPVSEAELAHGFARSWRHPGGLFPCVAELARTGEPMQVWLRCDAVADFCARHTGRCESVEGEPFAPVRRALFARNASAALWAVERHGDPGLVATAASARPASAVAEVVELFRGRQRDVAPNDEGDAQGFAHAHQLIDRAIALVGVDMACDLFFRVEREHWQARTHAARVQVARQDRLGLGWANHDHHTYRSSRRNFGRLIRVFEQLGFVLRERFYAGREAGWGAQVLEQPRAGVAIFADVDLSPDELMADFAHEPLAERETLGTVGLWCALHGDSFLQGGMHHLACRADLAALRAQLHGEAGIETMKPFTDFPHLKQAFTEGERRPVVQARIDELVWTGRIHGDQAAQFQRDGALSAHLEIVERNAGFKGFNQTGISEIITATDPRAQRPA